MAKVVIENLKKIYNGKTVAVENFSINIRDGEFLTLLGPSGCGKTTILRCIAGFIPVTEGKIYIGDNLVSSSDPKISIPPENRNIGMVFQSYAVWPHMNVYQNITYPLKIRGIPEREIKRRAERTIGVLKLTGLEDRYPGELSGGQQQRVALGRAIIVKPDVLLLDEPLSNLDAKLREEMRFELKELQKSLGITIVYVTHDQIEAISMSEKIAIISEGKVQQIGSPVDIYYHPNNRFVASFIGKANFIEAVPAGGGIYRIAKDTVIKVQENRFAKKGSHEKVTLMIRPHDLVIEEKKSAENIKAFVKSVAFLGDRFSCKFTTEAGEITGEIPSDTVIKEGDELYLRFKRAIMVE